MNLALWKYFKTPPPPPPKLEEPKPEPYHAAGRIENVASPHMDLPFSWQGKMDYTHIDTSEYEPFMSLVPYDFQTQQPIVSADGIATMEAARMMDTFDTRHMYVNPMQDLDYMKIMGVTKNSFAGPLMDSFTKFVVGTGFYPEIELIEPTDDPDTNKRIMEENAHVIQALRSIDRQFDFNSSGYLDVSLTALVSQLISGANIFNRAALVFRHGDKAMEVLGKKYPKIPTVMNYIHPQELGLVEVDNIGRLKGVAIHSDFNITPADQMIYLWNPLISAKYRNSKWYGGSMVLPMLDALQTLRKIHGVDLPTMARVAWAGLYLLTVKPQGQTKETKIQEYRQIAAAFQKPGNVPILMEDPEDTKLDKIDYEAKVKEFSDVAEHLIRYSVACLQLPNSMFFDESSSNRSTLLGKIQLAVSTAIDPVRQVLAEQLNAQWYMRWFEMIFKDQPEWEIVRPKLVFKDLHIDQWYDKIAATNEIDARHQLLDKAYGELAGISDYGNKIDPSKETNAGGSAGMGGKIKGASELVKNKSKGEGDRV